MSRVIRSQVSVKTILTVSLIVLAVVWAAWFFWNTTGALLIAAIALLISVALNRLVEWLEKHHVPRGVGIAIAMIGVVGALVGVGFAFIPTIVTQVEQLVGEWPHLLATFERTSFYRFLQQHMQIDRIKAQLTSSAPAAVGQVLAIVKGIVFGVGTLVTVLFVTIFMLAVGRPIVWGVLAQTRPERRARYAEVVRKVYRALGGYVAGHLLIVLLQCIATTIFLAIVGVPFFLPLGLLSGLASLIPFAGVTIVGTLVSLLAFATQGLATGLGTAAYYVVYQQFENHVLYPIVYRHTIEVNPLLIILAVLFFGEWGGIVGAILAVPFTAAANILVGVLLRERRERLSIPPTPPTPELLEQEPPGAAPH
ncbi:MAG TPA: AI-2E family transporter [Myxococcales bacterium]|jgi:predicted PurR-regulated permease PerM|nr:AI-2E family transporter [Myxococcales bacterium]